MGKKKAVSIRCAAKTKAGKKCHRKAVPEGTLCEMHGGVANQDALRQEYNALALTASRFADTIRAQLEKLLKVNDLTLGVPVDLRVKDWNSLAEKLERKRLQITSVRELDDLVGVRLILLFQRDLEKINQLISENFTILSFEDTASRLEETQFGYQSVHYVVSLPDNWLKVPTFADFKGLKAELQVRTLAQHIWAAASHKLQYKREDNVPLPLRRSIHRISAILETVDIDFEGLLKERDSYVAEITTSQIDRPLNVDVIREICESKWPIAGRDDLLSGSEEYSDLLEDLSKHGITTSSALVSLIDDFYQAVLELEVNVLASFARDIAAGVMTNSILSERVRRGVLYSLSGLTRLAAKYKFDVFGE